MKQKYSGPSSSGEITFARALPRLTTLNKVRALASIPTIRTTAMKKLVLPPTTTRKIYQAMQVVVVGATQQEKSIRIGIEGCKSRLKCHLLSLKAPRQIQRIL